MTAAPHAAADPDLLARARTWLADDPDPDTRTELTALLAAAEAGAEGEAPGGEDAARAWAELASRFAGTLEFGTAGLRGEMGAGPNRMNRAVVIRAAAGLCAYLHDTGRAHDGPVVIGYDARHKSAEFARDTAAVVVGAGLEAVLLPGPLPTPVLAFAVRRLGAAAGVMVTASHNPPRDNGYKVYLGGDFGGSQIVPPHDAGIAARIAAVASVASVPRPEGGWRVATREETVEPYLERAAAVVAPGGPRELSVVYTPLHGVGLETLLAAFARAGFPAPLPVAEQADPDPEFPTVPFPNPEEAGALDLAFATARAARHADLIVANDPDADRLAIAVPDADRPEGWRMLRGDEVGTLLGAHLARRQQGGPATAFAATIVSGTLLGKIAADAGRPYAETLTGFKWLTRVPHLGYAYEEALGYCVDPDAVRDKDGVTAALLVAELAADLKTTGGTLAGLLEELARRHGRHATDQLSVRVEDLAEIAAAVARLRAQPPTRLAGLDVVTAEDLAHGADGLPPTEGLRYRLRGAGDAEDTAGTAGTAGTAAEVTARIVVRPSGTEPKLKCYLEAVLPGTATAAEAATVLTRLRQALAEAAGL